MENFNGLNNLSLLFLDELAKKLKITSSAVDNWINNDKIPETLYFRINPNSKPRIKRKAFENYFDIDLDNILTYEETEKILRLGKGVLKVMLSTKRFPSILKAKIVGTARIKGDMLEKFLSGELKNTN